MESQLHQLQDGHRHLPSPFPPPPHLQPGLLRPTPPHTGPGSVVAPSRQHRRPAAATAIVCAVAVGGPTQPCGYPTPHPPHPKRTNPVSSLLGAGGIPPSLLPSIHPSIPPSTCGRGGEAQGDRQDASRWGGAVSWHGNAISADTEGISPGWPRPTNLLHPFLAPLGSVSLGGRHLPGFFRKGMDTVHLLPHHGQQGCNALPPRGTYKPSAPSSRQLFINCQTHVTVTGRRWQHLWAGSTRRSLYRGGDAGLALPRADASRPVGLEGRAPSTPLRGGGGGSTRRAANAGPAGWCDRSWAVSGHSGRHDRVRDAAGSWSGRGGPGSVGRLGDPR